MKIKLVEPSATEITNISSYDNGSIDKRLLSNFIPVYLTISINIDSDSNYIGDDDNTFKIFNYFVSTNPEDKFRYCDIPSTECKDRWIRTGYITTTLENIYLASECIDVSVDEIFKYKTERTPFGHKKLHIIEIRGTSDMMSFYQIGIRGIKSLPYSISKDRIIRPSFLCDEQLDTWVKGVKKITKYINKIEDDTIACNLTGVYHEVTFITKMYSYDFYYIYNLGILDEFKASYDIKKIMDSCVDDAFIINNKVS